MFQEGLFPDPHSMWPWRQGERKEATLWIKQSQEPCSVITVSVPFCHHPSLWVFRRRSCTSGLSPRSVWRGCLELCLCPQAEIVSPAPHVTLVSITMTQPPARPAHLEPTLMGWNVLTPLCCFIFYPLLPVCFSCLLCLYLSVVLTNCNFSLCPSNSVHAVSSRHWAHFGLRV